MKPKARLCSFDARPGTIRPRLLRITTCSSLVLLLLCLAAPAQAAAILGAGYDRRQDELIVDIAYRGTTPDHQFILQWGECRHDGAGRQTASARLIDTHGEEMAQKDFFVRQRYDINAIGCRPAQVTLRLGAVSHVTLHVPAAP